MHPNANARMALKDFNQRQIAPLVTFRKDVLEVANRLMIVEHEREVNFRRQVSAPSQNIHDPLRREALTILYDSIVGKSK